MDETEIVRPESNASCEPVPRLLVVDYFRGLAVFLMLVYDYVPFFTRNPPWIFNHGRTDYLLPGDFIAPFFLFIMGMGLSFALCRRRTAGKKEWMIFAEVLRRAVLLILIGLFIDNMRAPLFGRAFGFAMRWGVLETLGVSYVLAYLVMFLPRNWRYVAVGAMLTAHTYLLTVPGTYYKLATGLAHGGPVSAISWSTIAIFGMIVGEQLTKRRPDLQSYLFKMSATLTLIGLLIGQISGFTKVTVTAGYVVLGAGVSALTFLILYHLVEYTKFKPVITLLKPMREFGRSALMAFMLQYLVAALFIWYFYTYGRAIWEVGIPFGFFMVYVVWLILKFLNSHNLTIRI